jgi:hypothetical protein
LTRLWAVVLLRSMERPTLPRSRLNLWALSAIAQAVEEADHRPVAASPRLRLAMAWLTVSEGEGEALGLLWQEARDPMPFNQTDHNKSYIRRINLRVRFAGVCERMGTTFERIAAHARETSGEWP